MHVVADSVPCVGGSAVPVALQGNGTDSFSESEAKGDVLKDLASSLKTPISSGISFQDGQRNSRRRKSGKVVSQTPDAPVYPALRTPLQRRILFMSMLTDISCWEKRQNDQTCTSNARQVLNSASHCREEYWCFVGPGPEHLAKSFDRHLRRVRTSNFPNRRFSCQLRMAAGRRSVRFTAEDLSIKVPSKLIMFCNQLCAFFATAKILHIFDNAPSDLKAEGGLDATQICAWRDAKEETGLFP